MRKIIVSLSVIAVAAAVVIGGTYAFFSDQEVSTGNTFTAGAIDLQIDSQQHYNGNVCQNVATSGPAVYQWVGSAPYPVPGSECTGTWPLQDLGGGTVVSPKFFNFGDIKPGDEGENTISLHVFNNDAWVCAAVSNLTNDDNTLTEPETPVDSNGLTTGELQQNMVWTVWRDDGAGNGVAGDNIQNGTEETLASGQPVNGMLALYDSTTVTGPLLATDTGYIGVSWSLPSATGNEVQTDSMTGDITFTVVQSRNNADFRCVTPPPVCQYSVEPTGTPYAGQYGSTVTPVTITNTDCSTVSALRVDTAQSFGSGGWAGWSCVETGYTNAVGGGILDGVAAAQGLAEYGAPAVGGSNYPVYPHYTFNSGSNTAGGEEGWVVQAGSPVPTGIYVLCAP